MVSRHHGERYLHAPRVSIAEGEEVLQVTDKRLMHGREMAIIVQKENLFPGNGQIAFLCVYNRKHPLAYPAIERASGSV